MKNMIAIYLTAVLLCATGRAVNAETIKTETTGRHFTTYVVKPISNQRILPETRAIPGKVSDSLYIVITPGEYQPASFVIKAREDIEELELEVGELKSGQGKVITSSHIDIKVVKCWYQDEGMNYQQETPTRSYNPLPLAHKKVLVPELLLKDDSLIKVDTSEKHNYLRVREHSGVRYLIISDPTNVIRGKEREGKGVAGYPTILVGDSPTLQPVSIKKNRNKQFWITLHAPDDATEGIYEGTIRLLGNKRLMGTISLKAKVLGFKLAEPYSISSMYYYSPNASFYGVGIREEFRKQRKVKEQFKREMENMYAHGVTNPGVPVRLHYLKDYLRIREEVGMNKKQLFYHGLTTGNPTSEEELESLKKRVKQVIRIAQGYGIEEIYVYGIDEAFAHKSEEDGIAYLTSQKPAWEAVHEAGGKIFVAGVQTGYYGRDKRRGGNFGFMGDNQDMLVAFGYPQEEEAARWHGKGHKIVCYGNPQGGAEQPETYRRNYGLLLWQNDYDGAMTFIYHWSWGDFCRKSYKQHNMVYPTINGVIDTIQWEGYREGVDDVRYVNTLLGAIRKAKQAGGKNLESVAVQAEEYLKQLKDNDINKTKVDLDTVRLRITNFILELNRGG